MQKHLDFLNLLSKTNPIQQRALSETAEPDQVRAICECIYQIMNGNIPICQGIKEELIPKKQVLCTLRKKRKIYYCKVVLQFYELFFLLPLVPFLDLSTIHRNNGYT